MAGCSRWASTGRRRTGLLVGVLIWWTASVFGQSETVLFPEKPDPAVFVHDYAGWLSDQEKDLLEEKLRRYADSTSTEVVVMIRPEIGDYDRSSYAFELGNRWGIGRKSKNNGVVLLVVTEPPNRGAFIATGYGAEGALPDITAGRIIRNTMIPYFRQEQYFQGIDAALNDIIRALSGEFIAERRERKGPPVWAFLIIFLVIMIVILTVVRLMAKYGTVYTGTGPKRSRNRHDDWWGGGGWGGGFGGGGGGFGGGGGWGGGGFGGGSFGGGGAGGSW
ncbi:MAG: TPM domain-containing protein [Lewinellaceae bacterium]|nr:TPM domain-containing protein [Lewinellaceae bacterium]